MTSSTTLTSLAMLKVRIDLGGDYLDYLKPFILHVLFTQKPERVTDQTIKEYLRSIFGLEIPSATIQIVLKRIARSGDLQRSEGVYRATDQLTDPGITRRKSEANRHIKSVVQGLLKF